MAPAMRARISVIQGPDRGRSLVLDRRDAFVVGRSPQAPLCLAGDEQAALFHAVFEFAPPSIVLRHLGDPRGTFVNDAKDPIQVVTLQAGDRIKVGQSLLALELLADAPLGQLPTQLLATEHDASPSVLPSGNLVSLRCGGCGERTEHKVFSSERSGAACFCPSCLAELRARAPHLPGYTIKRELGRGGMGVVFLAEHALLGQRVLKVLLPEAAVKEQSRRLFLREARKQAALHHPNIVELFDLLEPSPGVFVAVMEYVQGESCDRLLERSGAGLPLDLAVHVVSEALLGLAFIHEQGLVHRDIKESNILLPWTADGRPGKAKIADFGLAKSYEDPGASVLTRPGQVGGTVPYMPPEQLRHFRDVRPTADIYAMGATLYRLLTGCYPHDFSSAQHPYHVILTEPVVPLPLRRQGLPPALVQVVETALAFDPARRYPTALAMRDALLAASPTALAALSP
jgi:eukaryotic-like serine/threonine-protein kinase